MQIKIYQPGDISQDKFLDGLIAVETAAWGGSKDLVANSDKIAIRTEVFSKGVLLAMCENEFVGSQYAFQFNWCGDLNLLTSWDDLTSGGNLQNVHVNGANTGFLVGVGVVPGFRGKKFQTKWGELKASELLIAQTLENLFSSGVTSVIGNARVPFYHKRADLSIEEYCDLRREDRKLFDPVLRFHKRMGAVVIKPAEYSMDDPDSLDAGAWVQYLRPFSAL